MDFTLRALVESASAADAVVTKDFYDARPAPTALCSHEEVLGARAARAGSLIASGRAVVESVQLVDHEVAIRIIEPRGRATDGVLLHFPGGGFYLSSAVADDDRNARRADATGLAVISVDYRLAPENPWPAAPDDCCAAAEWLIENASARFGTDRLLLGGFSAGATLVATTLLRLRDRGLVGAFRGALMEAGTYDLTVHNPSGRIVVDDYFVQAYVGHVEDRFDPDVSPAYGDLRDLPPTLVLVGSDDVVMPDSLLMATRLSAAGNDVELRIYPDVPHAFSIHPTPIGASATATIDAWLLDVRGRR